MLAAAAAHLTKDATLEGLAAAFKIGVDAIMKLTLAL